MYLLHESFVIKFLISAQENDC